MVQGVVFILSYGIGGLIQGKLFEKAGKPMWIGLVPIYNVVTMLELVGRPIRWIIDIAKAFGKDVMYGVGLCIPCVNMMLILMLAFGDAKYVGQPNTPA